MMANRKGFTLIEIIIVLVILGLALSFAIPNFINSIELTKTQVAKNNLLAISAAQEKYYEDNNSTFCTHTSTPACDSQADLNSSLKLGVGGGGDPFTYDCTGVSGPPATFTCTATDAVSMLPTTITLTISSAGAAPYTVTCAPPAFSVCASLN